MRWQPYSGALLPSKVRDLHHHDLDLFVPEDRDVGSDVGEVAVQLWLVPENKDVIYLIAVRIQAVSHELVGFTNEQQIPVLDTVATILTE